MIGNCHVCWAVQSTRTRRRLKSIVVAVIVGGLGSGCSSVGGATPAPERYFSETRLFISSSCLVEPYDPFSGEDRAKESAALVTALLTTAVDTGLRFASSLLTTVGSESSKDAIGTGQAYFYLADDDDDSTLLRNPGFGCLTLVRGRFASDEWSTRDLTYEDSGIATEAKGLERLRNLGLLSAPEMYFEGKVHLSSEQGFFRIVPTYFEVTKNMDWSLFTGRRDFVIAFTFNDPALAASEKSGFALGIIAFQDVNAPVRFKGPALAGKATDWMPVPALSGRSKGIVDAYRAAKNVIPDTDDIPLKKAKSKLDDLREQLVWARQDNSKSPLAPGLERQVSAQKKVFDELQAEKNERDAKHLIEGTREQLDHVMPINVAAKFTEIREANEYLKLLAVALNGALSEQKSSLKTGIVDSINPSSRTHAENAQIAASVVAQKSALTAYSDLIQKISDYHAAADETAKKKAYAVMLSASIEYSERLRLVREAGASLGVLPDAPVLPGPP